MSRSRALQRQRKLIVTLAVAGVTLLFTFVYAVAASGNQPANQRGKPSLAANNFLHDVDHSLHAIHSSTAQASTKGAGSLKERANSQASVILEELAEEDASESIAVPGRRLPGSSELLAGLESSKSFGVRASGNRGSARVGTAQRGGASRGRASSGFGGFDGGSATAAGGAAAQRSFGAEPLFDEVDLASAVVASPDGVSGPGGLLVSEFRPGAPLPIGFDPCLRDGLVVSPCERTSSELLQGLESPPSVLGPGGFGDLPQPRIAFFSNPPGQSGNGGGSGDGGGGESKEGLDDPTDSGGNGGGGFYPEESAAPVPAPAPVFLLGAGLMLLIRQRRA
ncbi:hypothetical protein N9H37_02515 [Congregibacter sp.]|nr:hypothetical protein [Congregibacter sp.]MDA8962205.1 hypothetical protein [Congregibacter sp.]